MNTALASLLVLLLVATPVAAREGISLGGDKSNPFSDPVKRKFLPAKEAVQASAWRDDERVYVGFLNAEDYYLHRHQFAMDSRSPGVSVGELALPSGERMEHASLGEIRVFYDQLMFSAPIESSDAVTEPLAIMVTFQGCSDQGLCYPPEQVEFDVLHGSPPAAFATSSPRDTADNPNGAP
jgi:thiol:disulfide interchange protein DsbD